MIDSKLTSLTSVYKVKYKRDDNTNYSPPHHSSVYVHGSMTVKVKESLQSLNVFFNTGLQFDVVTDRGVKLSVWSRKTK